jgi:precorrin-3B synthase
MIATTIAPMRRGACPGLSAPMPTGDGLLVRLHPTGTIPLAAFAELCRAARRHGNGIVEITSRGSVQVRGLSGETALQFAADIAALGIAADDGVPILCNPLSGIGAEEIFDGAALAAELRRALTRAALAKKLNAKVSVAIDGGGALSLAGLSADVRLRAQRANGDVVLHVAVGGDDATAIGLGNIDPSQGVEAAVRSLDVIARHGRERRARDIIARQGDAVFRAALAETLIPVDLRESENPEPDSRLRGNERKAVGTHPLRDGSFACGVGLAFGHSEAMVLERLTEAANAAGAKGFRAAPGRALFTIGLPRMSTFAVAAQKLGFVTRADDPRRNVFACAGAPICASAHIAARALAPAIASHIAPLRDDALTVHISGCAKGCAHAAPAALTIVGTPEGCALVADGSARDAAFTFAAAEHLPEAITRFARERQRRAAHV